MKKTFKYYIVFILFLIHYGVYAGENDSLYKIVTEFGIGYGFSTDNIKQELDSKSGVSWYARVLWEPDHLLKIGIETGNVALSDINVFKSYPSYGRYLIHSKIKAVPLMLTFDMNVWNASLCTGLGAYYIYEESVALDEVVRTHEWNVGFYLSLNYKFHLVNKLFCGPEIKWYSVGELGRTHISTHLLLSYNLFSY